MIEIKTFDELNEAIKDFRTRNGKVLTNCFLMPGEISALSADGKLFLQEYEDWLLLLCDREDYYSFYYYTTENSEPQPVKDFIKGIKDKEIFADIITRSGKGDLHTAEKLIKSGAAENYKTYQRMQLDMKNSDFSHLEIKLPDGYNISDDLCNSEAINRLCRISLDEKSTPLPDDKELNKLASEGNLFTVHDSNGDLAGVGMLTVSGKQGLYQHLCVSPNHRRKGIAAAISHKCILRSAEENLSVLRLWVDCKNLSAIALYDRLNFKNDGMVCEQLYMKGL